MKKRKIKQCAIIIILLMSLTACSPKNITDGVAVMFGKKQVADDSIYTQIPDGELIHTLIYDESFEHGGYYYVRLPDPARRAYQSIYNCISTHSSSVELSGLSDMSINQAYKCVVFDHPELFYMDGYQLEQKRSEQLNFVFMPNYIISVQEQAQKQEIIENYTAALMASLDNTSDYTKLKSIYDYIVANTQYNILSTDLSNICSVIEYHQAVCDGYAKATKYFCNLIGIECIVVPGYIRSSGTAHLWNCVKLDNEWYYVDPTWGDEDFENLQKAPEIRYDYLCVSQEQINGTHQLENFIPPPSCNSYEDN